MLAAGLHLIAADIPTTLYEIAAQGAESVHHSGGTVLLLCLADRGESEKRLHPWISQLPFGVVVWTHYRTTFFTHLSSKVKRMQSNQRVYVFVPWSSEVQRRDILDRLNSHIFDIPLVRVLFALGPAETLPYDAFPEVSCIAVVVNGTAVDAAFDGYRNCTRRKLVSAGQVFEGHINNGWSSLRGIRITAVTEYSYRHGVPPIPYTRIPESIALRSALHHLNVTINSRKIVADGNNRYTLIRAIQTKEADLSLLPGGLSEEYSGLYLGAVNGFRPLGFLSRRGTKVAPSLLMALSSSLPILACVVLSGALVTCTYSFQKLIMRRHTCSSTMVLYLVSNSLGKSSAMPASSSNSVTRILCLFWAFGMFSICAYFQCVFTSTMNAPTVARAIASTRDLQKHLQEGKIRPCLQKGSFAEKFVIYSSTDIAKSLRNSLKKCPRSCAAANAESYCQALARNGTHVFITVYDTAIASWYHTYLSSATDSLRFFPSACPTPKSFSCGRSVRLLVITLAETGAVFSELRSMLRTRQFHLPLPQDTEMSISFGEHVFIYIYGTIMATLVFIFEMICGRLRHNRGP